jgi:hypothetical protein
MGATTGARLPLAGQQARVNQLLSAEKSASALSSERAEIRQKTRADREASAARNAETLRYAAKNTDSYLDPVKVAAAKKANPTLDYLLSSERAAATAKNASKATIRPFTNADRAASAARDAETSRRTGAPLTQTPPGGYEDSFDPAQLNNARRPYPF